MIRLKSFQLGLHGHAGTLSVSRTILSTSPIDPSGHLQNYDTKEYLENLHKALKIILSFGVDHLFHKEHIKEANVTSLRMLEDKSNQELRKAFDHILKVNMDAGLMEVLPGLTSSPLSTDIKKSKLNQKIFYKVRQIYKKAHSLLSFKNLITLLTMLALVVQPSLGFALAVPTIIEKVVELHDHFFYCGNHVKYGYNRHHFSITKQRFATVY